MENIFPDSLQTTSMKTYVRMLSSLERRQAAKEEAKRKACKRASL